MKDRENNVLKLKQGCSVPSPESLFEGYEVQNNRILANIDAEKVKDVMSDFVRMHNEPLFFFLELPSKIEAETVKPDNTVKQFHVDVYYMDGCTQEECSVVLDRFHELLVNDGLSGFGFGCHISHDEIMFEKYNVLTVYSRDTASYTAFFARHGIPQVDHLVTAWETFSEEAPGEARLLKIAGQTVYDIPKLLKPLGMYFSERRGN